MIDPTMEGAPHPPAAALGGQMDDNGLAGVITNLGQVLRSRFDEWAAERVAIEDEWLKDLRQFKGIYEDDVLANIDPKKSRAFIRLTRTKVKSADARVMDMVFPGGTERNWSIDPTPVAEIDPKQNASIIQAMASAKLEALVAALSQQNRQDVAALQQTGKAPTDEQVAMWQEALAQHRYDQLPDELVPTDDEVRAAIDKRAKDTCESMAKEMDDQLTEARYPLIVRDVIHSGHTLGTGVLKGPLVETKQDRRWVKGPNGWAVADVEIRRPFVEFTPVWDCYPDMSVSEIGLSEGHFQRHVMTAHDLRRLKRRPDFNAAAIDALMAAYPGGNYKPRNHEVQLRLISKDDTFKAGDKRRRYEILEYWGFVDGTDLQQCGCPIPEGMENEEFEANVWMCDEVVIKAVLNPSEAAQRPYHYYYFEKDDTSIFGVSIPSIYRVPQQIFNSAIRAALDNGAITAGPAYEVNLDLLDDDEDGEDIHAFRVIFRRGKGQDAMAPAVRAIDAPSHIAELLRIAELAKQLGDESTTLPSYTHGEQDKGVSKTVGGLSMLMGAANITLKDVVRNFDDGITKPFISSLYHWNMQFSQREDIKGDYQVSARGATSLVAKEIYAQQLDAFAASVSNPIDGPLVRRLKLLQRRATSHDLDPGELLKTEDEVNTDKDAVIAQLQQALQAAQQGAKAAA